MIAPSPPGAWIDISLPIGPDSIAWAGLPAPRLTFAARIDAGAAVTVGRLDCSLHTGTHADAPWHVLADGVTVDLLDPAIYIGPAVVIRTENPDAITVDDLRAAGLEAEAGSHRGRRLTGRDRGVAIAEPVERVLVATPRPYDGVHFPDSVPHLAPAAARFLVEMGVRLIGVNVPSLDPLDSTTMDAHRIIFGAGGGILENLDLGAVASGVYDLVAAPIRVVGADAAPVRALVRARADGSR